MNIQLLQTILIRHEGAKLNVYKDSLGLLTVGVGHLVLSRDNLSYGEAITEARQQALLETDIQRSILLAKNYMPLIDTLDDVRWVVLVSLAFNLGNRLSGFKQMLSAVNNNKWDEAALQLQDSKWFTQVGRRGPELCFALRNGRFGFM